MPKPKVYGTPIGIAGGPSERPSGSQGRQKPRTATDEQVRSTVRKEMSATGRQSKSPSNGRSGSKTSARSSDFSRGVNELRNPGRTIKKKIEEMGG